MPNDTIEFLETLEETLTQRIIERPDGSYTASLAAAGLRRVAQKTGEEAIELALAAVAGDLAEVKEEAADLVYHLLVLLALQDLKLADIVAVLRRRHSAIS